MYNHQTVFSAEVVSFIIFSFFEVSQLQYFNKGFTILTGTIFSLIHLLSCLFNSFIRMSLRVLWFSADVKRNSMTRPSALGEVVKPSYSSTWDAFLTGGASLSLVSIWSSGSFRSSQSSQKMFRRSGRSYRNATQTIANDPDDWDDLDRLDRVDFYPDDRDDHVNFEAIIVWRSLSSPLTLTNRLVWAPCDLMCFAYFSCFACLRCSSFLSCLANYMDNYMMAWHDVLKFGPSVTGSPSSLVLI